MKLKPGTSLLHLQPQTVVGMMVAQYVLARYGAELVITSGSDGKHGVNSLHYAGLAFDARIRDVPDRQRVNFIEDLRESLGKEWDIVLESDHVHIEYDPKSRSLSGGTGTSDRGEMGGQEDKN